MSLYSRISPFLIGAVTVATTIQFHVVAEAKTEAEIRAIAKAITVRIDGPGKPGNNGSGIIIERRGDTYTVLTCWHVVDEQGDYTIQPTIDNQRYPVKYSQIRRLDNTIDLAIIEFSSQKNYQVAKIGDSDAIKEGMLVYAAGWYNPGPIVQERIFDNPKGRYVSRILQPLRGYELVYTLELAQTGISGGPLLNDKGAVIGINGLGQLDVRTGNTNLIAGIPIKKFMMLRDKNIARENSRDTISPERRQNFPLANVQQLISLGETKYNQKDYRGAIDTFSEVIRLDKNNALAYHRRGIAYSNLKEYQKAIADFNQAIRLDPKNVIDTYNSRGLAYSNLKEYQKAIADFNQAIRLDPKSATTYNNRGVIYHTLKEYQKAIADFNQAIGLDPKNVVDSYNNRGLVYKDLKEYQKAIADFDRAINLNPKYAAAYNNRGVIYHTLKEYQKAIADFDRAIGLEANFAHAYYNRGLAYKDLKQFQKATENFNQASKLYQQQANDYWYQRSQGQLNQRR